MASISAASVAASARSVQESQTARADPYQGASRCRASIRSISRSASSPCSSSPTARAAIAMQRVVSSG